MTLGTAQEVLQKAYGSIRKILPANIVFTETQQELFDLYDKDAIERGVPYWPPDGGPMCAWQPGYAARFVPGLAGFFADTPSSTVSGSTVYVWKHASSPTVTCHELLHANTARDFLGTVGEAINEGTTELLAMEAMQAAGFSTDRIGSRGPTLGAYPEQRSFTIRLIGVVGKGTLTTAYFNGATTLVRAFEAMQGKGTWSALVRFADALDIEGATALLTAPSTTQKIAAISHLLDNWTGDDDDTVIEGIYNSPGANKPAIRVAVQGRVRKLISRRTQDSGRRLRELFGL